MIWLPAITEVAATFVSATSAWAVMSTESLPLAEPPSSEVALPVLETVAAGVEEATW